jgi:hypothetical protein
MSYLAWCFTSKDSKGATNALRFATEKEAESYAKELWSRWTGLDRWEIRLSTDKVNYVFDFEAYRAKPLEE